MRRKPRPPVDPHRQPWQVAQAERCPCRGADDLCQCQNADEPWKYGLGGQRPPTREQELERRVRELEGLVRTLELRQQTDRQTGDTLRTQLERAEKALREIAAEGTGAKWTDEFAAWTQPEDIARAYFSSIPSPGDQQPGAD